MRKIIYVLLVLLFSATGYEASATHTYGGEITWECNKDPNSPDFGKFRFYLYLFRDCSPGTATLGTQYTINSNSPAGNIPVTRISVTDESPTCVVGGGGTISCGSAPPAGYTGTNGKGPIELHVYRGNWITISGTPPATGWTFSWSLCCRPTNVLNLTNSSGQQHTLRAFMFPYNPGGGAQNTSTCYDDSPTFLEPPSLIICTGYSFIYNQNAFDTNLDSLHYDFATAMSASGGNPLAPSSYAPGYSFSNPMPGAAQNPNNLPATIDGATGRITFTSFTTGAFVIVVKVEAWRCGQKIAEVFRDITVVVGGCPSVASGAPNQPPQVTLTTSPTSAVTLVPIIGPNGDTTQYEADVFAGENVSFTITATDFDFVPGTFLSQTVKFSAAGGNLGAGLQDTNACLNPPCATIFPGPGQPSYVNVLNNNVVFNWDAECTHLAGTSTLCGATSNTYVFEMRMEDDWCPAPAIGTATVVIRVNSYVPLPPDLSQSCISIDPTGNNSFNFNQSWDQTARGFRFNFFIVYRADNPNGPFIPVDTIYDINQTLYTDLNSPGGTQYYYMRTNGGCDLLSITSDTLSTLDLDFSQADPNIAFLEWTGGSASSTYELLRELPSGSGNWVVVNNVTGLSYNDTLNICNDDVSYQVRFTTPNGITCSSNIVSAYFTDTVNNEVMVLDSVSVAGGQAVISWIPSTDASVVEYTILKFEPGVGWVPIDVIPAAGLTLPYVYSMSSANDESEAFKVVSVDSCGNQSVDLSVDLHRTMHLSYFNAACENLTVLNWNSYQGWPGGVGAYYVVASITDEFGIITTDTLASLGATDTTWDHTTLISGYNYCYSIIAVDTSGQLSSTSNTFCIDALITTPSEFLYLGTATVLPDGGAEIFGFVDPVADVRTVRIERAEKETGPYEVVANLPKPTVPPFTIQYSDFSAMTDGLSYFYRLVAIDSCDALDTTSNFGRTIFAEVTKNGNVTNTVRWNPYTAFGGEVERYSLYRSVDDGVFTLVNDNLTKDDTIIVDNVRAFGAGEGSFCYRVVANEGVNPDGFLAPGGVPFQSVSNDACVNHEARVFIPSAFNVNSDNPENQVWRPQNIFSQPGTYEMKIFDRWGAEVFTTTNTTEAWDGTVNGNDAPMGVYVYFIKYKSKEGFMQEEKGSLTLIR